jgi:hypothetical protein
MISFEMRRTLKSWAAAALLVLATGAAPLAGFSQAARDPDPDSVPGPAPAAITKQGREIIGREQQIAARIEQEQSTNGPYSERLIQPLQALALLYEEGGDRDLAAAALEQASQVVRANYGLRSLEQAPLLEQAIRNEETRGDAEAAWDLEQDLLGLVEVNANDLRTVPILRQVGDRRLDLLERYYSGEIPPEIILGCYYGNNCVAGSRGKVIRGILSEAKSYYSQAIDTLLRNGRYPSDEIRDLSESIVQSSYRYGDYRSVKPVFDRIVAYQSANPDTVPLDERVDTLIQAADWGVLLSSAAESYDYDSVLDLYARAFEQLEREGAEQAAIEAIFTPKIPVVLPTALPNPLASERTDESTGYIDVSFEITKRGKCKHVEVLDTTTNASRAAERDLVRRIRASLFRPRTTNGDFDASAPVVMRYYVKESPAVP